MKYCNKPFQFMHFDPNGGIRLCAWTDVTIGNVLEDDIETIWNGEKAEKVRESIINQSFEYCRSTSCPYLENQSLQDLEEDDFKKAIQKTSLPTDINAAYDFTCNHACPSCRHEIFRADDTYKENIKKVTEQVIPLLNQAEHFATCGNGDLFASKEIMEVLQNIRPQNSNCRIALETNGVLFDEKHWETIEHLKDFYVEVTVTPNSYDRETYQYLSGGFDNLERLQNNLLFIKKLREQGDINKINISIVLQDRNFRELPSFVEKSINDYGADTVIVKPLYKWFAMTEEEYWFKDVLNPLHPYHQDYLKMIEHPVLSDPRVYFWGAHNLHEKMSHPAVKYKKLLDILQQFWAVYEHEDKIVCELKEHNAKRIIIYGDNVVSYYLYQLLHKKGMNHVIIVARDCTGEIPGDIEIEKFCAYEPQDTDEIIITQYFDQCYIVRDLDFIGYKGKIINVSELIDLIKKR